VRPEPSSSEADGAAAAGAEERRSGSTKAWFRRSLVALHRDLGYLAVGLTLVYAISGIAVNHRHHWDPNQSTDEASRVLGRPAELLPTLSEARRRELASAPTSVSAAEEALLVEAIALALGRPPPKNRVWRNPDEVQLFFGHGERDTVSYQLTTGSATERTRRDRLVMRDLNFLHLNEGRRIWTWIADGYAIILICLALSGVFIARGRRGLLGRGGVLLAAGVLVPLLCLLWLRYS
jgi:hypothetical protein